MRGMGEGQGSNVEVRMSIGSVFAFDLANPALGIRTISYVAGLGRVHRIHFVLY